jgi:branched-chain amino acid transport system ATP-binding protein
MTLVVRDLHAGYAGTRVLTGLDVSVESGGVVAMLGANGVGKTTLLRAVSGLVRPDKGTIVFEGERIDHHSAHRIARRGVIHVPEGRGIFPGLSVDENLALSRFTHARGRAAGVADLDRLFPVLSARGAQRAGTLSGGEAQMLAVARALSARPRLLLLDEPSLGLAPLVVEELYGVLGEIKRAGISMLIAEQAVDYAMALADYVYVLGTGGRVVVHGPSEELASSIDIYKAYLS